MAFREVGVHEIKEVLRLWLRGEGIRSVARLAQVDRKTVRRYEASRFVVDHAPCPVLLVWPATTPRPGPVPPPPPPPPRAPGREHRADGRGKAARTRP